MYIINAGRGGVICDQCKKLIDSSISYSEYEETWEKSKDDGDFCLKCKGLVVDNSNILLNIIKKESNYMDKELETLRKEIAVLNETLRGLQIAFAKSQEMYNRHIADLHVGNTRN